MTSDITFRMKRTSREKSWNFVAIVALTQLTILSITVKQSTKACALITDKLLMKLSTHPLNQQLHVIFTTYSLVVLKVFTLYSAKYKKTDFKSSTREDATFHSTSISHTQVSWKLENILNKLLKKLTVHVLHHTAVPTSDHWKRLQHTFRCFWTKTRHAAGAMKLLRKGHVMCRMLSKNGIAFWFVLWKILDTL